MKEAYIKFDSISEVEKYSENSGKIIMRLGNQIIQSTSFAQHHPGGAANIQKFKNEDITEEMKRHHLLSYNQAESMTIGFIGKKRQKLIDHTKPLAYQIWQLNREDYIQVVNSPHWFFVPSPVLFQSQLLEQFSYSSWWQVSVLPTILITYMFWKIQSWSQFNIISSVLIALAGALLFTLVQYLLHRFVFHADWYLPDNRILRMLHFFLHGIHHMLPNDPSRLVLPPPFALIICTLAYPTILRYFYIQNPIYSAFFWSGYLTMYVIYDSTHYFLHFLDTSLHPGTYFQQLQKYHNQHHYGGQHAGFGVSSKLWDIVFRSQFTFKRNEIKRT